MLVAGGGILLAWLMYVRGKIDPSFFSERAGVPYRTIFNKYYVDEIYEAVFVNGVRRCRRCRHSTASSSTVS